MEDDSHWEAGHLVPVIMDDEDAFRADQIRNGYREAAVKYVNSLKSVLGFIADNQNPKHAALAVSCAFGFHSISGTKSQSEIGKRLGIERAAVSKCVKMIQRTFGNTIQGMGPMPSQKSAQACKIYSRQRTKQLKPK